MAKARKHLVADITSIETAWLAGEWLLGSEPYSTVDTMSALALMSGVGSAELWEAHGDDSKMFWRPGMDQPITREDLEHHEACWLEAGEAGADLYGGESRFVHTYYTSKERQALWDTFGDKALYKWNADLRRPIPISADENNAINSFLGNGPFDIE